MPSIYSWWEVHVRYQYMYEYADVARHDIWRRPVHIFDLLRRDSRECEDMDDG